MDLTGVRWRKSRRNGGNGGNCVEAAPAPAEPDAVAVRDSKDPRGPELGFARVQWARFVAGAKKGRYDR